MFRYICLCLVFVFFYGSFASAQGGKSQQVKFRQVGVVTFYKPKNGRMEYKQSWGFIVGKHFIGVCGHATNNFDQIDSIQIVYELPDFQIYCHANLKYKPTSTQYDFSTLELDSTDIGTDFRVLETETDLPVPLYSFRRDLLKSGEIINCISGYDTLQCIAEFSFEMGGSTHALTIEALTPSSIGAGNSGSLVYDLGGNVVGVMCGGYYTVSEALPNLNLAKADGKITQSQFDQIISGIRSGKRIALILNINFILQHYLVGYH